MSDLLIKDMKMPKNCFDCPFLRDDFCIVLGYEMRNDQILMGCGSCPLVEVKPHGDLIDRDEAMAEFADRMCVDDILNGVYEPAVEVLRSAPTVLEAFNG